MIPDLKKQHKEQVQTVILDTALRMAEEDNWDLVTLRKLSNQLGVTTTVVYNQFPNKDAILNAISLRGFKILTKDIKNSINHKKSSKQQLRSIATAYWNFAFDHKRLYEVMFSLGKVTYASSHAAPELKKIYKTVYPILSSTSKSKVSNQDISNRFNVLWSYMHGSVSLALGKRLKGGNERLEATYLTGLEGLITWLKL